MLFTHKIVTYITPVLSIVEGKEGILQCSCENTYACVNNTCWGRICFYSSVHERVVRGCFPTSEQCHVPDLPGLYTKCCLTHLCNANLSVPEKTGKSFFLKINIFSSENSCLQLIQRLRSKIKTLLPWLA